MNLTPMIFGKIDQLTADATTSIKSLIVVAGGAFILFLLFKREGSTRLVVAGLTAAVAVWLVAGDGVQTVGSWVGVTLES